MNAKSMWNLMGSGFENTSWRRAVAIGIVLVLGWNLINVCIWAPTQRAWQRQAALKLQVSKARIEVERVRADEAYLANETAHSLTGHAAEGAHRYQEWLLKRTAEMPGVSVLTSPVTAEGSLGSSTRFEIAGEADLDWIASFIDELNATPLQHRIVYLKLSEPQRNTVQFTCTVEALFLEGAISMQQWPSAVENVDTQSLLTVVREREPFTRGYRGPIQEPQLVARNEPVIATVSEPPIDPFATLKLVGLVSVDGKPQAWIVDSRTNQQLHVLRSAEFAFADRSMHLIEVERDAIEILCGTSKLRWPLGATLRSVLSD